MSASLSARPFSTRRAGLSAARGVALASIVAACASRQPTGLTEICSGAPATATVDATIDSVRPPAGAALAAARGQHFTMRFAFSGASGATARSGSSDAQAAGSCDGRSGTATVDATLPEPLRNAASPSRQASWRIEGGTVMLDLNTGTRDNNIFVALPLSGGQGHWGLSTFAGEVAGGATRLVP